MGKLIKLSVVVYRLRINLLYIKPPIWRQVLVPARITLNKLHQIIQAAMGWEDRHLHQFLIDRKVYSEPDPDEPGDWSERGNESKVLLSDLVTQEGSKFIYDYDFGDSWRHEVILEKVLTRPPDNKYPVCQQGRRHCPPEDCGGPPGYENLVAALADRNHPEHAEMLDWVGPEFDPDLFDKKAVNLALAKLQ